MLIGESASPEWARFPVDNFSPAELREILEALSGETRPLHTSIALIGPALLAASR
jgi:hypothetical protein